ncbi:MAG: potassium channel family protein [Gemmatimonadetes bacterium]|nr:potassium channel family protein [Gemmatimonadota bacterium]
MERERWRMVLRIQRWLETPMLVLGGVWLVLLIFELTRGLTPFAQHVGTAIWIIFIADFALRFAVAPRKGRYLRSNWLTAASLALPALRVFRVFALARAFRLARVARGLRLVKVVGSLNRGMRALDRVLRRRGFGYVVAVTVLVAVVGAAGMYALEREAGGGSMDGYAEALWWTGMILTTLGSDYWPKTPEGRLLTLLLSVYAVSVFGYVAATLASYFVERDAAEAKQGVAGQASVDELRGEIAALREELRRARAPAGPAE